MRRVARRLSGSESWDKEFLILCIGDPWNPKNSILGSTSERFANARPTEEWTKVRSRRTYLNRSILECRKRTEGMRMDADAAFDTTHSKTHTRSW